ncbi:pentatricopeptide repeat-containing protein At1g66345, mitochondrial [Andrographis paniculata]|uniref:pentatricopeptide repeat-containing protein At1g66345, mitochondrial n=1 Tax=Andrographis paniculata TaxID=175694 RepID=UPI0021E93DA4|nr:pentatricopeptide repeat-containing protein At1g66345, mitochondrial [Andrographis paniculata]
MFQSFRIISRTPLLNYCPFFRPIYESADSIGTTLVGNTSLIPIIDSLHKGHNWTTLSEHFSSLKLTNPGVQQILLELKEPINSRKALSFFHWSSKKMHFQHGRFNYCIMIHILAKAGLVKDAKALLNSVLTLDFDEGKKSRALAGLDLLLESYRAVDSVPFVFDLFIQSCARLRLTDDICDAAKRLSDDGFTLSVISFNAILDLVQKSEKVHLAWSVFEDMILSRVSPNEMTMRIMVNALCREGKLVWFLGIVDNMHGKRCSIPQVIVHMFLVHKMIEEDRVKDGLVLLNRMLRKHTVPDTIAYSLVVLARVKLGDLDDAKDVYNEMLNRGFKENAFVCSLFVGAYSDEGRIDEAIWMLEEMEKSGLKLSDEAFSKLIKGCSSNGRMKESLAFCNKMMMMGHLPSCSAVNEMLWNLCENGETKQADEMLTALLDKGFQPNGDIYSVLIHGYGKDGNAKAIMKLLFEMKYRSIAPNMLSFNLLIDNLCKSGRSKEVEKCLEIINSPTLIPG